MTTIGEILQSARERKKLTVDQVEQATKIRARFIVALEANRFDKLPGPTYARGFVKNYAAYLGLPIEDTLAFYRRQSSGENLAANPKIERPVRIFNGLRITPQFFTISSVGLLLTGFFIYLGLAYFQFSGSPKLSISSPANNVVVTSDSVEIAGKTDPGVTLSINNQKVEIGEDGAFSVKVPLQPGINTITVLSTNKFGRKTEITRNLRLEK